MKGLHGVQCKRRRAMWMGTNTIALHYLFSLTPRARSDRGCKAFTTRHLGFKIKANIYVIQTVVKLQCCRRRSVRHLENVLIQSLLFFPVGK